MDNSKRIARAAQESPLIEDDSRRLLGWIERLYALTEPRRFAEYALLLLLDVAEAQAGYVVFSTESGAVGGAVRGGRPRLITRGLSAAAMAPAVRARLAESEPVIVPHEGPTAALAGPVGGLPIVSLRLFHVEADCASLWVLARQRPFGELAARRLGSIERAVTYAGDLMLPRLPGGPRGFYTRVRVGVASDGDLRPAPSHLTELEGLAPIAADCACLAARGYTNREISAYLRIGQGAVARYLSLVYRHLRIDGRHQLDVEQLLAQPKPAPRLHRVRRSRRPVPRATAVGDEDGR